MSSQFLDDTHHWAVARKFTEPTYMKHVQHMEDRFADRLARSQRERNDPLHTVITKAAAKSLRDITQEASDGMPQDDAQVRKACLKSPNSGLGLMISSGASLEELASFVAKRTLERWVRVLKPFASGPGLAVLVSRLVHEEFNRSRLGQDSIMTIVPPLSDPLGRAMRDLTPSPDAVLARPWILIEDCEAAMNLEGQFNVNPDHPLRPNSKGNFSQASPSSASSMYRPHSVGSIQSLSPKGVTGAVRRSGAFPWNDFQEDLGSRQTTMVLASHKQLRKFPGPDRYGDVTYLYNAPTRAPVGRFPGAGARRTQCTCTGLSTLGRYFESEHVIAS